MLGILAQMPLMFSGSGGCETVIQCTNEKTAFSNDQSNLIFAVLSILLDPITADCNAAHIGGGTGEQCQVIRSGSHFFYGCDRQCFQRDDFILKNISVQIGK